MGGLLLETEAWPTFGQEPDAVAGGDLAAILRRSAARYPRLAFTCSFGGTGIVLAHVIAMHRLPIPVYFLDTGYLFPETLALRHQFAERYGLEVIDVRPELSVLRQAERDGDELYRRDPDRCCALRKVDPMRQLLEGLDAWVSGMRRDQSASRGEVEVLERHTLADGRVIAKINPMAHWTRQDAWRYIAGNDLPYNPLADRGYKSIGCWPCTRPVGDGEDERAGRWAGTGKTECGLHTFTSKLPAES